MKYSALEADGIIPHTVAICAAELDDLAKACLRLEPIIGDLLALRGASLQDILILQDLDRIQQHMVAVARILKATESEADLFEVTRLLPLASLRSKLMSEFGTATHAPGEIELF